MNKYRVDFWHFESYGKLIDYLNSHQDEECYQWENIKIVYGTNPKFAGMNWCLFYRRLR